MDPVDDFEFKPLTEGLGFHKKAVNLKEEVKKSGSSANRLGPQIPSQAAPDVSSSTTVRRRTYEDLLASLEQPLEPKVKKSLFDAATHSLEITEPLPREKRAPAPSTVDTAVQAKAGVAALDLGLKLPEIGVRRSASDNPPVSPLEPTSISFASAILDLMVVTALTLIFLLSVLMITKVDLLNVFLNTKTDGLTQLSLLVLFVSVMQMYVVMTRSFFGATLGEWTFDHQLGTEQDQRSATYPLRVALRSVVISFTGVLLLPIISWIAGRDLTAKLTGLQLYRQRY